MLALHVYTKEGNKDKNKKLRSTFEVKSGFLPRILCLPVICLWEAVTKRCWSFLSQVKLFIVSSIFNSAFSTISQFLLINIYQCAIHYFFSLKSSLAYLFKLCKKFLLPKITTSLRSIIMPCFLGNAVHSD